MNSVRTRMIFINYVYLIRIII